MSEVTVPRFLIALVALIGFASAQSSPWVRLDLIFVRVDIGGDNAGLSLILPRVGVAIGDIVGVSVGIGTEPVPPSPFESFMALETELAAVLQEINTLLLQGGSPAQLAALHARADEIARQKAAVAARM